MTAIKNNPAGGGGAGTDAGQFPGNSRHHYTTSGAAPSSPSPDEFGTPDPIVAWNLARFLAGVSEVDAGAIRAAYPDCPLDGPESREAVRAWLQSKPDLLEAVIRVDPAEPPPSEEPVTPVDSVEIPELPAGARLSDRALAEAERVGAWLETYVDYATRRSPMTPRSFHEAGGLWLGSVAIARRLYCPLPHDNIWPNLYILWVAGTTLFAKSTALKIVEELARDVLNHLLLPSEFTPEALLSELAGKEPPGLDDSPQELRELVEARRNFAAQRGLIYDEFSGILASAKKDYNAGLTETLLRLHDCPPAWERRTQTHGLIRIQAAYLSLLSATTPKALSPYLSRASWLTGFWPRFALLTPEEERPVFRRTKEPPERPRELVEELSRLANVKLDGTTYPNPPKGHPVVFSEEAYEGWERYDRAMRYDLLTDELDESLWGLYGRLPTQAVKVATILAALDWDGAEQPTITLGHWAKAQQIVETWRASAHRLLVPARVQEEQHKEERVLAAIRRAGPQGITIRELYHSLGMERDEVEAVIRHLTQDGLVVEVPVPTTKRGGRPTRRYVVAELAPKQWVS